MYQDVMMRSSILERIKMSNPIPFTLYWPRGVSMMLQDSICKHLGITRHMTVNRETVVWLNSEQVEKLEKVKEQGLLIVRKKENKIT